ncbi:MAG: hypothetical protein QOC81_4512 [Thermoanaerobaculia bacterium]|nr:hypothetical protein [Thermoanaerobaculia bacterium]
MYGKHRFDLLGVTLSATRLDDDSFAIKNGPLAFHPPAGAPAATYRLGVGTYPYVVHSFAFPLGSKQYRNLYVTAGGAIYFQPPPGPGQFPFVNGASAVALPLPVVAPLLLGAWNHRGDSTEIFVNETFGQVIVTWRFIGASIGGNDKPGYDLPFAGDMQAVLRANGDIEFSYPSLTRVLGGAPVITTGSESVRDAMTTLATIIDPTLDIAVGSSPALDLRTVEINRQPGLDRLEVHTTVGKAIDLTAEGLSIDLTVSEQGYYSFFHFTLVKGGPAAGYASETSANLVVDGTSIRLSLPENWLPAGLQVFKIDTNNAAGQLVDSATISAQTRTIDDKPETDLSAPQQLRMPIAEAFRAGSVDPFAVSDQIRKAYRLSEADVDAVAVYTTSPTDVEYWGSSYAWSGISGADNNGKGSFGSPRSPGIFFMGTAEHSGPLLYFFGSRWLFQPEVFDGGSVTTLSYLGAPPRGLDMTAAFTGGSSAVGGYGYIDRGNGQYQTTCLGTGFSWLELYLMGLARPEEVPPVNDFGTTGPEFCGGVAKATIVRRLTIKQFIDAMGPRTPAFDQSPKHFPVVFALVEGPEPASTALRNDVSGYAFAFANQFHAATGGRGDIVVVDPSRRRAARQ